MNPITFPGLGLTFHIQRVAFQIFGKDIYWYGIIIAAGFLLAAAFCSWRAKDFGIKKDDFLDMLLWGLPIGIICARIYYVIFYLSLYRDGQGKFQWSEAIAIWDGGLALYGGVIGGILTCLVVCKHKKLPFLAMADLSVMGLFIGQIMGRWGNFVNQEAYGGACDLPWRMGLIVDGQLITVHPTFLYESLWNLMGLCLLFFVVRRVRRFDGELFLCYLGWYGLGRFWIEGLRTDSLYLFDWTLFDKPIRVSQVLSLALALAGFVVLIIGKRRHPHGKEALFVTKQAALAATAAAAAGATPEGSAVPESEMAADALHEGELVQNEEVFPTAEEKNSESEEQAASPEDKE